MQLYTQGKPLGKHIAIAFKKTMIQFYGKKKSHCVLSILNAISPEIICQGKKGRKGVIIIELFELEGTSKSQLVQLPTMNRDTYSSVRCSEPIQPDLEYPQDQGIHHLSGQSL